MGIFGPKYRKMLEFFSFPIVSFFVNYIITSYTWKCQALKGWLERWNGVLNKTVLQEISFLK